MSETPLPGVDVIIPCFNMASYLPTAIESALGQTYPNVSVIVVNDGSMDETAAVAQNFGTRIKSVDISHSGLSTARNAGIDESSSDFLLFLDADDWLFPDAVEQHLRAAVRHTTKTILHSAWQTVDESGDTVATQLPYDLEFDAFHKILSGQCPPCHSFMIRRSFFEAVGTFDTTLPANEDWDLWLRFAAAGLRFIPVPQAVAVFRRRQHSMRSNAVVMHSSYRTVLERASRYHHRCEACKKIYSKCIRDWCRGEVYLWQRDFSRSRGRCRKATGVSRMMRSFIKDPQLTVFLVPRLTVVFVRAIFRRALRLLTSLHRV